MKISNETKVGILTIVALTMLILGFNFLKGKNIFNNRKKLYAVFADLGSLEKSNEVKINGLPVGVVYDYKEIDKNMSGIIVTINMNRDVNIPKTQLAPSNLHSLGPLILISKKEFGMYILKDGDTFAN